MRVLCIALLVFACSCTQDSEGGEKGPVVDTTSVVMRDPVRSVPVFVGVDQNGDVFNSQMLRGRWWIGSFFFTSCETVCPMVSEVVAHLQTKWSSKVSFVSVSTDPDNDTQEVLAAYAQRFGAVKSQWYMVRMPIAPMMALAESGMGVMKPVTPAGHSTRLVLVDDKMQVRDYFDATDSVEVARLEKVLQIVQSSSSASVQ